jgi:tetratricopeptide (TPR) repeat protein
LLNDKRALLFKAEALLDMIKYDGAIEYFRKVLPLDPSNEQPQKEEISKAKKERLKK